MIYPWHKSLADHIKDLVIGDQLAHAYLIVERANFYDDKLIRLFSRAILCDCEDKIIGGQCKHCQLIDQETHPNWFVLNCKEKVSIDDIRSIDMKVWQTSHFVKPKIIELRMIDYLSINAQNALLKILEEPPKNTFFILSTEQKSRVLPTIISRVHYLPHKKIPHSLIVDWLNSQIGADDQVSAEELIKIVGDNPQDIIYALDNRDYLHERQRDKNNFISFLVGDNDYYDLVSAIPDKKYSEYLGRYIRYTEMLIKYLFEKKLDQDGIDSVKWRGISLLDLFMLRVKLVDLHYLERTNVNLDLQMKKELMGWQDDRR